MLKVGSDLWGSQVSTLYRSLKLVISSLFYLRLKYLCFELVCGECYRASGQAVGGPVERLWNRGARLTSNVGWGCCGTDKVRDITRQTDIDWVEDIAVWETRNIQQLLQGSRTGCGCIYCNQVPTKNVTVNMWQNTKELCICTVSAKKYFHTFL